MRNRKPFDLRTPLALWSLFLGIFSLIGSLRTFPTLFKAVMKHGIFDYTCSDSKRDYITPDNGVGVWIFLFVISKIPEFVDTFFIVLRKKKLIFLHWYHHITVMIFCWNCFTTLSSLGAVFASINFTVHAIMYIFYFLTALGYKPKPYAMFVTVTQILQMFVGVFLNSYPVYIFTFVEKKDMFGTMFSNKFFKPTYNYKILHDPTPGCKVNPGTAIAGLLMYISYLILFVIFFYNAYVKKEPTQIKKKTQ